MLSRAAVALVAVIAVTMTFNGVVASTQAPPESMLLTEVRLMRQSIDAMAANHLRVQLVFARIQAQQVPLARAAAMLQVARSQLTSFNARYDDMQERVSQLEAMANDGSRSAEDVENLQREISTIKADAARLEVQRSAMLAADADAARQHADEQTKMDALHAQLAELERTLLTPHRP